MHKPTEHSPHEHGLIQLDLEIEELEKKCRPGCGSSTTLPICTCPIILTTTGVDLGLD